MAITQGVIQAVCDRMGDAPVQRVCLEIGTLSGVVADSGCAPACPGHVTAGYVRLGIRAHSAR